MGTDLLAKPIVLLQPFIAAANDLLTGNTPPASGTRLRAWRPGHGPTSGPGASFPGRVQPHGRRSRRAIGPPPGERRRRAGPIRTASSDRASATPALAPAPRCRRRTGRPQPRRYVRAGRQSRRPQPGPGSADADPGQIAHPAQRLPGVRRREDRRGRWIRKSASSSPGSRPPPRRPRPGRASTSWPPPCRTTSKDKGHFPRGHRRPANGRPSASSSGRRTSAVSWMAELLPYLGDGEFANLSGGSASSSSWQERDNLRGGRRADSAVHQPRGHRRPAAGRATPAYRWTWR